MFRKTMFLALGGVVALAASASAGTAPPPPMKLGTYVNVKSDTRSITKVTLRTKNTSSRGGCNDDGTCTTVHTPPSYYRVRLWGSCSPEDCDWGATSTTRPQRGGPYIAHYDQGFAKRRVEIHAVGSEMMRLVVHSTYDDNRSDRSSTSILARRATRERPGARSVTWEGGTNRPGADFRNFWMNRDQPGLCAMACEQDRRCRAYTYVKPGVQGANARCWLKNGVPSAVSNNCCVSGVK
ncbi:PAN domain-containing protein [Roseovarius salinarum]|uniref:PAN domain-containing protein n=1 Tax=Roseovarius salinarum TaxID=1981892 RepID=UPI000C332202|nr:PAN domain-containing protein [Roseovarius salinarum]